ncbi:sulfatase-like hydrolase/transferase [Rhodovulum sulfidophilum]|uniref:sulfatase-like hydrolase/transferase n=1 Tax=Rhodovulum sulfidophilum TaxID=35806 RepID=UPI00192719BA|nr:sulfatase-like hydrolase/transferase [Rhodovulum sulfidophilum]MBL3587599.1 sulfatase-like hydrolase/transferase [Rhodovulum sulfidophilum]
MARPFCGRATISRLPNILIVSLDALRKDFVATYSTVSGPEDIFSRGARSGVVFDSAMGSGNWTVPSHASLFTGQEGQQHGIYNWRERIPLGTETLFDQAVDAGYRCAFLSSLGVGKLVDNRVDKFTYFGDTYCGAHKEIADDDIPWCVFWHFLDTHAPYNMTAPRPADLHKIDWQVSDNTINWLRELICTRQVDRITDQIRANIGEVSGLIDDLWSRLGENTLVVLMSDHGEDFRRHMPFHCSFETSVLRIPLTISAQGLDPGRDNRLIAHADLKSVIWDLATTNIEQRQARMAQPTISQRLKRISICGPDAFDNEEVFFAAGNRDKLVVIQPSIGVEQRYILNHDFRSRVYRQEDDPVFAWLATAAEKIVTEFFDNHDKTVDVPDDDVSLMLEQLEKLGYIS